MYKGFNLNINDLEQLIEMVNNKDNEKERKLQIEGLMIAYLDIDTANDEVNNNFNKKVIFRFTLN